METLLYLAKVGIIYSILYLIYYLFFRNNTNFQANRFYLLLILPFAFILPIINSSVEVAAQFQITLPTIEIDKLNNQTTTFNWSNLLIYGYAAISLILMTRFLISFVKTLQTISEIKQGKNNEVQPFSFFSFIHVSGKIKNEDRAAILHHEQIHSTQLHSLDIIIYEISKVLLWWDPFLWMGLNSVKSNHEFIADKLASVKADKYSSVLVAQLLGVNCSLLANNFSNEPLIKKRIKMMKTKKSNRLSVLKYALIVPVIAITIAATNNKEVIANPLLPPTYQGGNDKVYETVDVMPEFKGGNDELMKYLGQNVVYPTEAKKNNISGKVFVGFIVDKKGNIKDISIVKSAHPLLDAEAMRVIKGMPKWTPGKHKGKKVSVKFTVPIMFALK